MKHTPGPWRWTREHIRGRWHAFLRSTQPVETLRCRDSLVTAMREDLAAFPYAIDTANARLMEAAPELLDALRDLVQRVDTTPIADGSNLDTAWAHALIARIDPAE